MTQARGTYLVVLFIFEATFGETPAITPGDTYRIEVESESLNSSRELLDNPHQNGEVDFGRPMKGRVDGGGDLVFRLNPLSHGFLWKLLLGEPATTGAGPYQHVYTKPAVDLSATIEKGFTDVAQYFKYVGCVGSKLTLAARDSGYVECTLSILLAGGDRGVASMDSAPSTLTDNPFDMAAAAVAIKQGGVALGAAMEFNIEIDRAVDGDSGYTMANQGKRSQLPSGKRKVSGTLNAHFLDEALYDLGVSGAETTLELTMQHGTGDGSAGNEKGVLSLEEIQFGQNDPVVGDSGGVDVSLPFTAYYDDGASASAIKFTLDNAVVDY